MLHPGEASAISLALEVHADLLLIDEALGRKAAVVRGIHITGTVGIIEQAADRGLLDLKEAFAQLKETDFWISSELLDARLHHKSHHQHSVCLERGKSDAFEDFPRGLRRMNRCEDPHGILAN